MLSDTIERPETLEIPAPAQPQQAAPEWLCALCGREADPLYRIDGRDICGDCRKALQRKIE